jgi:hypothetical protein
MQKGKRKEWNSIHHQHILYGTSASLITSAIILTCQLGVHHPYQYQFPLAWEMDLSSIIIDGP